MKIYIREKLKDGTINYRWVEKECTIPWSDKGFITQKGENTTITWIPTLFMDDWELVVPQPDIVKLTERKEELIIRYSTIHPDLTSYRNWVINKIIKLTNVLEQ